LEQLEDEHDHITSILWQLQQLEDKKAKFISDECIARIDVLLKENATIEREFDQYMTVTKIVNRIDKLQKQLDSISVIDITELRKYQNMIDSKQEQYERIVDIIEEIEFRKAQHTQLKTELAKTEKNIENELKKLGACPTCGRKV
jgi:DNA repair exonuclease SbcCD ATPase subunit